MQENQPQTERRVEEGAVKTEKAISEGEGYLCMR